jgi:hypothetical protein
MRRDRNGRLVKLQSRSRQSCSTRNKPELCYRSSSTHDTFLDQSNIRRHRVTRSNKKLLHKNEELVSDYLVFKNGQLLMESNGQRSIDHQFCRNTFRTSDTQSISKQLTMRTNSESQFQSRQQPLLRLEPLQSSVDTVRAFIRYLQSTSFSESDSLTMMRTFNEKSRRVDMSKTASIRTTQRLSQYLLATSSSIATTNI